MDTDLATATLLKYACITGQDCETSSPATQCAQKVTTFVVETVAFVAKDFTTPEWAPTMTFACRLTRSSVFSDLSIPALRRFNAWKSSSSAPAPDPVPKTEDAATSTVVTVVSYSRGGPL